MIDHVIYRYTFLYIILKPSENDIVSLVVLTVIITINSKYQIVCRMVLNTCGFYGTKNHMLPVLKVMMFGSSRASDCSEAKNLGKWESQNKNDMGHLVPKGQWPRILELQRMKGWIEADDTSTSEGSILWMIPTHCSSEDVACLLRIERNLDLNRTSIYKKCLGAFGGYPLVRWLRVSN